MTPVPNEMKEMSGIPIVTPSTNDNVSNYNTQTISKSIEDFASKNCDTFEGEGTLNNTFFSKSSYKHESCSSVDPSDNNSNFLNMHTFCCYHHCDHCDTCMCVHHPSEDKSSQTNSMEINGYHDKTKELTSTINSVENKKDESLKNTSCDQPLNSTVNNVPIKDQESLLNSTSSILTNCFKDDDSKLQKRKLEKIENNDDSMVLKKCKVESEDQYGNSDCSSKSLQNKSIVSFLISEDYKKNCVEKLAHSENTNLLEVLKVHGSCQGNSSFLHESCISLENLSNENIISSVSSKDHKNSDCVEMSLPSEGFLDDLEKHMEKSDLQKSLQETIEDSLLVNSENFTNDGDCPETPLEIEDCLVDSESHKRNSDSAPTKSVQEQSEASSETMKTNCCDNASENSTIETLKECYSYSKELISIISKETAIISQETSTNNLDAVKIDNIVSCSSENCEDDFYSIEIENSASSTGDNCIPDKKIGISNKIDPSELKRLGEVRVVIDPLDQIVLNRIDAVGNLFKKLSSGAGPSKVNNSAELSKTKKEPSIVITLSSDSEESEEEDKIRVGEEFQAPVEDFVDIPRLKGSSSNHHVLPYSLPDHCLVFHYFTPCDNNYSSNQIFERLDCSLYTRDLISPQKQKSRRLKSGDFAIQCRE